MFNEVITQIKSHATSGNSNPKNTAIRSTVPVSAPSTTRNIETTAPYDSVRLKNHTHFGTLPANARTKKLHSILERQK